jgi:hypothetical protein
MFKPFKSNYGYGWLIDTKFGQTRFEHGGGIMGFVTVIARYPAQKLLIVALCNLENSPVGAVGNDLAAIALSAKYVIPREPKAAKVDPAVYDAYVGQYEVDIPGKDKETLTISRTGDRLAYEPKGRPAVTLTPESDTSFYMRSKDAEVRFVKEPGGKVAQVVIIQDNEEHKARKIAAKPNRKQGDESRAKRKQESEKPAGTEVKTKAGS